MYNLRLGIAIAAVTAVSAAPLAAQQTNTPPAQNPSSTSANQPATGPAAPNVTPSRRDKPGSTSATNETPPVAGANSFTESQAIDRIAKSGFTDVKNLKKDDKGIWRGQAQKGGSQVSVALDYRGNVVQQ